jgi:hypothetical protein
MAAPFGADADAQASQTAANHKNVGIDYFHGLASFVRITSDKSEIRISKSETNSKNQISKSKTLIPAIVWDFTSFDHLYLFRISCLEFTLRVSCLNFLA